MAARLDIAEKEGRETAPGAPGRDRFRRFEFKYRLPPGLAHLVRAVVATHLPHDAHCDPAPDHHYDICSLYLDSADLRLCRESLTGQKNRFKLRIRSYDDSPDSPVYLEIKRRLNMAIMKDRCGVPRRGLQTFSSPGAEFGGTPSADQFRLYCAYLAARPQTLVRYRREAFESAGPSRVRVTFDRDLCCRPMRDWSVRLGGRGWREVLPGAVVLEIKYSDRYPTWLQELVRRFQLQARSVSKYTLSLNSGLPAARGFLVQRMKA